MFNCCGIFVGWIGGGVGWVGLMFINKLLRRELVVGWGGVWVVIGVAIGVVIGWEVGVVFLVSVFE